MAQIQEFEVGQVATAGFAHGKIGAENPLKSSQYSEYGLQLGQHAERITLRNTADCGDGRKTIALADGTTDPMILRNRVVAQVLGGPVLALTKSLTAANSVLIRDCKTFKDAYEKVYDVYTSLKDQDGNLYKDGGHEECGASITVEKSVASPILPELLVPSIGLFVPGVDRYRPLIDSLTQTKHQRLESGFYGSWESSWHEDFLRTRTPETFSTLDIDHNHDLGGHYEEALFVVTDEDYGFAKNKFIEDTGGRQSFAVTPSFVARLASLLGTNDEERATIYLAFADDTLHVGGGLMSKDTSVFATK